MSKDASIVDDPDFGLVLLGAMQHVIGRRSYAVAPIVEFVQRHWRTITPDHRSRIQAVVKSALQRNEIGYNVRMWQALLKWMESNA